MTLILSYRAIYTFFMIAFSKLNGSSEISLIINSNISIEVFALNYQYHFSCDYYIVYLRCKSIFFKENIVKNIHRHMTVFQLKHQCLFAFYAIVNKFFVLFYLFLDTFRCKL